MIDSEKARLIRDYANIAINFPSEASNMFERIHNITNPANTLTKDEIVAGVDQGKLACIKLYKTRTGLGLMDSKNFCEQEFERLGLQFKPYQ